MWMMDVVKNEKSWKVSTWFKLGNNHTHHSMTYQIRKIFCISFFKCTIIVKLWSWL